MKSALSEGLYALLCVTPPSFSQAAGDIIARSLCGSGMQYMHV